MVTKTVYKQIRGFVAIWLSITFVMGLSTFLAIYFTYNPSAVDPGSSNPLPLGILEQGDTGRSASAGRCAAERDATADNDAYVRHAGTNRTRHGPRGD